MPRAPSVVQRLGRTALDLVFPPRCGGCGSGGSFLCPACAAALQPALPPRCLRCWRPGANPCDECELTPPPFAGLRAAFVHDGNARTLVHALKYRGLTALAAPMAVLLAEMVRRQAIGADWVVPVPLSGRRRRTRGYNQAEVLAKELARELDLPLDRRALVRRRHSPAQATSVDVSERRRNVADAFAVRGAAFEGATILLVDDVTTTGATLAACATALRGAGAGVVWGITFARED